MIRLVLTLLWVIVGCLGCMFACFDLVVLCGWVVVLLDLVVLRYVRIGLVYW